MTSSSIQGLSVPIHHMGTAPALLASWASGENSVRLHTHVTGPSEHSTIGYYYLPSSGQMRVSRFISRQRRCSKNSSFLFFTTQHR